MWRALRAFGRSRGVACGPRRQFAGAGWKASRGKAATSAQRGRSRTQVTELARMEFARSAAAARRRADGVGSIDPALRALAGTVAGSNRSAGHQQERGERALRLRHRAQVGGADESRTARAPPGSLANPWRALRRAC